MDRYIDVPQMRATADPVLQAGPSVSVKTDGPLMVEFTANNNHCSDMIAHLIVDGGEWGSNRVGPGQPDGGYFIPVSPGTHTTGVKAEGIKRGCNPGYISAWRGALHIETNTDALKGRG